MEISIDLHATFPTIILDWFSKKWGKFLWNINVAIPLIAYEIPVKHYYYGNINILVIKILVQVASSYFCFMFYYVLSKFDQLGFPLKNIWINICLQ